MTMDYVAIKFFFKNISQVFFNSLPFEYEECKFKNKDIRYSEEKVFFVSVKG